MHDVGGPGGLGFEQLPREVRGELEHRSAERGSALRYKLHCLHNKPLE